MAEKKKKEKDTKEKVKTEKKPDILGHVILSGGRKKAVVSENGKYYVCKDCQFRKTDSVFVPLKKKEVSDTDA